MRPVEHKVLPPGLALQHTEEGGPQGDQDGQHIKPLTKHRSNFGLRLGSQREELEENKKGGEGEEEGGVGLGGEGRWRRVGRRERGRRGRRGRRGKVRYKLWREVME